MNALERSYLSDLVSEVRNLVDLHAEALADRDRARDVAVALEQEVADLRERLEFATWGIA